jgi:hypothetical protein
LTARPAAVASTEITHVPCDGFDQPVVAASGAVNAESGQSELHA